MRRLAPFRRRWARLHGDASSVDAETLVGGSSRFLGERFVFADEGGARRRRRLSALREEVGDGALRRHGAEVNAKPAGTRRCTVLDPRSVAGTISP